MKKILIVEDDPHIRKLLEQLIRRRGVEPVLLADGAEAARYIEDSDELPNLVLLDMMLPVHSGVELLKMIRANERWKPVPVVLLTGRNGESDIVEAFRLGVDDYVVKPFLPMELFARMDRLLPS